MQHSFFPLLINVSFYKCLLVPLCAHFSELRILTPVRLLRNIYKKERKQRSAVFPVLSSWCFLLMWLFHSESRSEAHNGFIGLFRDGMAAASKCISKTHILFQLSFHDWWNKKKKKNNNKVFPHTLLIKACTWTRNMQCSLLKHFYSIHWDSLHAIKMVYQ